MDGDGDLTAYKFARKPWLATSEEWPKCSHCKQPLEFFLQLNLNQLPEALKNEFGRGILQMFYCTYMNVYGEECCELDYEGWEAFSDIHFLVIIQPEAEAQDVENPEIEYISPPKLIVDWQQSDNYPNYNEAANLDVKLDLDLDELFMDKFPVQGDKLAGWPLLEQEIEYPNCPICDERMELVFQLYSEDNSPFRLYKVGHAYITQCQNHKHQLAFSWSSC
ncbi:MAG: DUF1963 domain-containing protein [Microcoleaceae cyanobacterium]